MADETGARMIDWNVFGPRCLAALAGLTTNPHLSLSDLVYQVREHEGEGWDGPAVTAWGAAVTEAEAVLREAKDAGVPA